MIGHRSRAVDASRRILYGLRQFARVRLILFAEIPWTEAALLRMTDT